MGKIERKKLLDRQHDRRDARLFIVATEGKETEKQYFGMFGSSRIKVEVLSTGEDNKSAPDYILERLNIFKDKYDLNDDDMLWLVIDVDRWGDKKLSEVCREAKQRGYHLAVSNPCFEVWLYLHLDDLNAEDRTGGDFEKRIRQILGSYNKSNLDLSKYQQTIHNAVSRAKQLHPNPSQNWPPSIGSHIYKLVEILLEIHNS